jgi:hypothetical protein
MHSTTTLIEQVEYRHAFQLQKPKWRGWKPRVVLASAKTYDFAAGDRAAAAALTTTATTTIDADEDVNDVVVDNDDVIDDVIDVDGNIARAAAAKAAGVIDTGDDDDGSGVAKVGYGSVLYCLLALARFCILFVCFSSFLYSLFALARFLLFVFFSSFCNAC